MRVDQPIRLADHSFAVAEKHKLEPDVLAMCDIKSGEYGKSSAVTYSGNTYIAIRSMKHDTTTTYDHGIDVMRMYEYEPFKAKLWSPTGPKPVLVCRTDGGPDQNLRNQPTRRMYGAVFKRLNLDCLIVSMSAPGSSAYNEGWHR